VGPCNRTKRNGRLLKGKEGELRQQVMLWRTGGEGGGGTTDLPCVDWGGQGEGGKGLKASLLVGEDERPPPGEKTGNSNEIEVIK